MRVRHDSPSSAMVPFKGGLFVWSPEAPDDGYLIGWRCQHCDTAFFPLVAVCPKCDGEEFRDFPLSREGTIYTCATVRRAPPPFTTPYTIGYVDLPEQVRVFTQFSPPESPQLQLGARVRLVFETLYQDKNGRDVIGYRFRPIEL